MKPFEIYVIHMKWGADGKIRPVLAFVINTETVGIYQITTKYDNKSENIKTLYFKIEDWSEAGLAHQSYIDTGTLISLPVPLFKNKIPIGKLTDNDKKRLFKFLK